ncbi:hypothetical protein ACROYT_G033205 [Oculina patagonica]
MKFAPIHAVDKKVNKSLQDRLRRERISKSVDALRELVLGSSIEHGKIGKEEILKLTVQYIRRQKERMETNVENHKSMETYRREPDTNENDSNKQSDCSPAKEQVQTRREEILEKEVRSENAKTLNYDENCAANSVLFSRQSQSYPRRFAGFRNETDEHRNGAPLRRTPFRELNFNNKQEKSKQTIWRPW